MSDAYRISYDKLRKLLIDKPMMKKTFRKHRRSHPMSLLRWERANPSRLRF